MYELNNYNFTYDINNKQEYKLSDNTIIIKNLEKFYDLRIKYQDHILYKNLFIYNKKKPYLGLPNFIINNFAKQFNNPLTFTFNDNDKHITNKIIIGKDKCTNKNNLILAFSFHENIKLQFDLTVKKIDMLFNCLNENGMFIFQICGIDSNMIKLIHLLLLMFDRIVIYNTYVICYDYKSNKISKEEFNKLTDKIEYITIKPLSDLNKLNDYMKDVSNTLLDIMQSIHNNNLKEYFKLVNILFLNKYVEYQYADNKDVNYEFEKDLFEKLKLTSVSLSEGIVRGSVKKEEGDFLYNTIINNKFKKCLEVGMAYGISAMYILLALKKLNTKNIKLYSIDPNQSTQWNNFGVKLVKNIKMNKYHKLIEDKSYNVLPQLTDKKFDFIFIDGWHTFDYTLLDFFYASLMLRIGGIIVVDDAYHEGVNKFMKYIDTNYPHFKKISSPSTVCAYKKLSEDKRDWNFHKNF
jgi:predicted O-methyltransferase YrrM